MNIELNIPDLIYKICAEIEAAGGQALLVGGAVVDLELGIKPKDFDIEVYRMAYSDILQVLSAYRPKTVGRAFGVVTLHHEETEGLSIDVSVPRRENSVGLGHKDFNVQHDPRMSPKEAALRRDYTINSQAYDLKKGKLIDPFNGRKDLQDGVLRATNGETFRQDPLRVLRGMQLLARKLKTVDQETIYLCKSMKEGFASLPGDRKRAEFTKLLMRAALPSMGLRFLSDVEWLQFFPELAALPACKQNLDHHPEGDVFEHTCHTVDSAAWARDKVREEWREAFVYGAMLHDVGKPAVTVTDRMVAAGEAPRERLWTAHGHDKAGMVPAMAFMEGLTTDKTLIQRVVNIVGAHMQPFFLSVPQKDGKGARKSRWGLLHEKVPLDVLGWQCRCDACGRPNELPEGDGRYIGDPDLEHETSELCWQHFEEFGLEKPKPLLRGNHLIAAGLKPGRGFKDRLQLALEAQMDGETSIDELLKVALAM